MQRKLAVGTSRVCADEARATLRLGRRIFLECLAKSSGAFAQAVGSDHPAPSATRSTTKVRRANLEGNVGSSASGLMTDLTARVTPGVRERVDFRFRATSRLSSEAMAGKERRMRIETHERDEETADEVIERAGAEGVMITRDQLERWHRAGALPAPRQTPLGPTGGSVTLYPKGAAVQAIALARGLKKKRRLDEVAFALWLQRY